VQENDLRLMLQYCSALDSAILFFVCCAYKYTLYCTVSSAFQATAADAFLAFDSSGVLTCLNKLAEALVGAAGARPAVVFCTKLCRTVCLWCR